MPSQTIRYTTTLPQKHVDELRALARGRKIPSVNFAINEAVSNYLQQRKAAQYEALLKEAGQDKSFLKRTLSCDADFSVVDSEVSGEW